MPKLDDAQSLTEFYLDEIDAAVEIRQSYNSFVVGQAGALHGALAHDSSAKATLNRVLKHKASDPGVLYKSLVVQAHGIFENYIRFIVDAVVVERFETLNNYSELDEKVRNAHVAHVSAVLTHIRSGAINGVSYNFQDLLSNFGKSLTGQKGFKLNSEVYTKLMGNCTPDRIDNLFKSLSLPQPFKDQLLVNTPLRSHFGEKSKSRASDRAKETLEQKIHLRNDIVHGDLTRAVDLNELRETVDFFRALTSALTELVKSSAPD